MTEPLLKTDTGYDAIIGTSFIDSVRTGL